MIQRFVITFFSFICFTINIVLCQPSKVDSLLSVIGHSKNNTEKIRAYECIGNLIQEINLDSSLYYYQKALEISTDKAVLNNSDNKEKKEYKLSQAKLLRLIGITYAMIGDYSMAKDYYLNALSLFQSIGDLGLVSACYLNLGVAYCELGSYDTAREHFQNAIRGFQNLHLKGNTAKCYSLIGNTYNYQGIYDKAIEYYLKALRMGEEVGDIAGMSACYTNMGGVYYYRKDFQKAIELYSKSLEIDDKLKDRSGVSINYNNIGLAYSGLLQFQKALDYYQKSLEICISLGEKLGQADCLNNIGLAYKEIGDYDKALDYYLKSLKVVVDLNDKNGEATAKVNIADLFVLLAQKNGRGTLDHNKNLNLALFYGLSAIKLAQDANLIQLENYASKSLMNAYKESGNCNEALKYAENLILTNDSLFAAKKTEALADMEAKYQNEKKQKEIELLEKDKIIILEKSKKQKIIIASITTGLGFLVFMVTFILRRLRITRRQKRIIEEKNVEISAQNTVISQQNDDIVSSITYASRIQSAMIPPVDELHGILPNHFVLFKPRDIVSGDFFWTKRINNQIYIVVADCTGHGVPGAFMSMLGISLLNDILSGSKVIPPHQVLNELRARVIKSLRQTGDAKEAKDGMDIALCLLDMESNILHFAGAKNPLYLIRNGELVEYKADTMPIGIHPALDSKEFTSQTVEISPSDTLYIFSDGYVSQLGGDKYQTFKTKRFQELLRNINGLPMDEQKQTLDKALLDWQGEHRQVDDICVIGFRVGVN